MTRNICEIAREICHDWRKPYFGAVPYIRAMQSIDTVDDFYGFNDASCIIRYFLANAGTWRGTVARRIKSELREMIK